MLPDIPGYQDAMRRLSELFGVEVTFSVPPISGDIVWDDDTSFDPETGLPLDPTIEPISGGDPSEITVTALISHHPGRATDETLTGPLGMVESADLMLILLPEAHAEVQGSTQATVFGERRRITEWRPDGLQGVDRWLVYTEGM